MYDLTTIQLINEAAFNLSQQKLPIRRAIAPDIIRLTIRSVKATSSVYNEPAEVVLDMLSKEP